MKRFLIVEGRNDAVVLRTLLRDLNHRGVNVVVGGGKSAALSLGASYALSSGTRAAIVVDADTKDRRQIDEQQLIFRDLYRREGAGSCRLFLAIPTLEADLFPTPEDFEATFGLRLTVHQRARFNNDWNLVIRAFLSIPQADSPTFLRTREFGEPRPATVADRPLMRDLIQFLG